MQSIMVLNAKGGCGKSTLATNIASYFANQGKSVAIADFDPQASSTEWLAARDSGRPEIIGLEGYKGPVRVPRNLDYLIIDPPAGLHGKQLTEYVRRAQTIVVPVLPSPMDMRAAQRFVEEIQSVGKVVRREVKLAMVANRVRENTLIAEELDEFLTRMRGMNFLTTLRDTQNYIRAAERGLGIFELAPYLVAYDLEQWTPLIKWLSSKRSLPNTA